MNTYKARLSMSKESREAQELEFQVEEAQQQLDADLLATRRDLKTAKQRLEQAKSAAPFSSGDILRAKKEVSSLEQGVKELEALKAELFGPEEAPTA